MLEIWLEMIKFERTMTKAFKSIFQKATESDKEEIKQTIKNLRQY